MLEKSHRQWTARGRAATVDVSPGEFCAKRASWITASLGWTAVVWVGAGGGVASGSRGTGEPSLDRLSGVCTPLEWADNAPVWLGDAGALLPKAEQTRLETQCSSVLHVRTPRHGGGTLHTIDSGNSRPQFYII